jgi:hypothetical protein
LLAALWLLKFLLLGMSLAVRPKHQAGDLVFGYELFLLEKK